MFLCSAERGPVPRPGLMVDDNAHPVQKICAALTVFVAAGMAGEARAQAHPSKPDTSPDDRWRIPMKT
jgi:hypothetical protein